MLKIQTNQGLLLSFFIIIILSGQTIAGSRGVFGDYFGTGRTDYLTIDITPERKYIWDLLRNPVTDPPQTRRTFWGSYNLQTGLPDLFLQGDWDGDLKTDIAVWRPGSSIFNSQSYFYIQPSTNPNSLMSVPWGRATGSFNTSDLPVTGDFDGDGKDDYAVNRNEGNQLVWYILPSGGGSYRRIVFGLGTDGRNVPMFDFNNDGRDDIAVFRISQSGEITHYIGDALTGDLILAQQWGNVSIANGLTFYGNYIGDERADIVNYFGVCESANPNCGVAGTFWIKETGSANYTVTKWGIPTDFQNNTGDYAEFGDYDGDGRFDITVRRPSNSTFYTILSSNGQFQFQQWAGLGVSARNKWLSADQMNKQNTVEFSE